MESTNGPAGNRDEDEGINLAGYYRAAARNEWRYRGHLQVWVDQNYSDDQESNRSDLEIGRKVIARAQQQPHRQNRGNETVSGHQQQYFMRRQCEGSRP